MTAYHDEVEPVAGPTADAALTDPARTGGRFKTPEQAPTLGRILFHLLQK